MRRKFLSAALVALSIAMAACGNDGDGEAVAPEPDKETQQPSNQPSEPKQE